MCQCRSSGKLLKSYKAAQHLLSLFSFFPQTWNPPSSSPCDQILSSHCAYFASKTQAEEPSNLEVNDNIFLKIKSNNRVPPSPNTQLLFTWRSFLCKSRQSDQAALAEKFVSVYSPQDECSQKQGIHRTAHVTSLRICHTTQPMSHR